MDPSLEDNTNSLSRRRSVGEKKNFTLECEENSETSEQSSVLINLRYSMQRAYCSKRGLSKMVRRRIPILNWIFSYDIRANFLPDLISGVTVGIYNIPQGLSYSTLAMLPPVHGLYASFFPPLIYFLFGSSRHTCIGVFSLVCLMIGHAVTDIVPVNQPEAKEFHGIPNVTPVDVAISLGLLTAAVQALMFVCRLYFLSSYLSDSAIAGMTFGAAFHAFISQIPNIIGIPSAHNNQLFFSLFHDLGHIFSSLSVINYYTTVISLITLAILLVSKRYLEPICMKKEVPFPTELIILIFTTILSVSLHFHTKWHVKVIGIIPLGMPSPRLPRFSLMKYLIEEAISISIVSYSITLAMGKLFAAKHSYRIDDSQELFSLSLANGISSFFSAFPSSASLSRTLVNEGSGAKTQVSGLISSLIILTVIFWLGPFLEALPMCTLSCIVVVALRSLFLKVTEITKLWRYSKTDVAIWILTAFVTICMDIIEGLAVGMLAAMAVTLIQLQWPTVTQSGEDKHGSMFVITLEAPPIFINSEYFKKKVVKMVNERYRKMYTKVGLIRYIYLDCSYWFTIDKMGATAIKEMQSELQLDGFHVKFINIKPSIESILIINEIIEQDQVLQTSSDAKNISTEVRPIRAKTCN